MISLLLIGLLCSYIFYYICKKEYYENSVPNKKEQPYTSKIALESLNVFIRTLNKDTNNHFIIYNVESIKRKTNKLYIKCFVQHSIKKYVRLYFAEIKLPFKKNSKPVLSYYGEYGNGQIIENGTYSIKDSAHYSIYNGFVYDKTQETSNTQEINNIQETSNTLETSDTMNHSEKNNKTVENKNQNLFYLILQMLFDLFYKFIVYLMKFIT